MSQYVNTPTKTFVAGGAIAQYLRVYISSLKLAVAGIGDKGIGTIEEAAFADGDLRAVRLTSAQGTFKGVMATDVTAGAAVYTAASGKFSKTKGTGAFAAGIALETGTADGDVIEILRNSHGDTAG